MIGSATPDWCSGKTHQSKWAPCSRRVSIYYCLRLQFSNLKIHCVKLIIDIVSSQYGTFRVISSHTDIISSCQAFSLHKTSFSSRSHRANLSSISQPLLWLVVFVWGSDLRMSCIPISLLSDESLSLVLCKTTATCHVFWVQSYGFYPAPSFTIVKTIWKISRKMMKIVYFQSAFPPFMLHEKKSSCYIDYLNIRNKASYIQFTIILIAQPLFPDISSFFSSFPLSLSLSASARTPMPEPPPGK